MVTSLNYMSVVLIDASVLLVRSRCWVFLALLNQSVSRRERGDAEIACIQGRIVSGIECTRSRNSVTLCGFPHG